MKHLNSTEQMMTDTRMQLATIFDYGDKISTSSSLEMRVPMLDIQLVLLNRSSQISSWSKTNQNTTRSRGDLLPSEIVNRPKKGLCSHL